MLITVVALSGWGLYEFFWSPYAVDLKKSEAMCASVTSGMSLADVKQIAQGPKVPQRFGSEWAAIGYGGSKCIVQFENGIVVSVGKPTVMD